MIAVALWAMVFMERISSKKVVCPHNQARPTREQIILSRRQVRRRHRGTTCSETCLLPQWAEAAKAA